MKRDAFGRRLSPLVRRAPSNQPAAWLEHRMLPWGGNMGTRVCSVVPLGFEAYGRVLHPAFGAGPDHVPLRWRDIGTRLALAVHAETQWESLEELTAAIGGEPLWHEPPWIGRCPPQTIGPLSERLAEYTRTPDVIYFAMWIGFADVQSLLRSVPRFELPHREYALLMGPITELPSVVESPYAFRCTPSLAWPADHAWCMATEVDFRWTYVGGPQQCIRSLETDRRLEVIPTNPNHRGDVESDWVEGRRG